MSPLLETFGAASAFGWIPRANPNITSVESSLWSGGSNSRPGASVVKDTGLTLLGGTNYVITIGAANASSSALGKTANVSGTSASNTVNGVTTTYSTFGNSFARSDGSASYGPYGAGSYNEFGWYRSASGGAPGAAGNGGNGFSDFPYGYNGGVGGAAFTVTGADLSGFPVSNGVGRGGGGIPNPMQAQYYAYIPGQGTFYPWEYGNYGNTYPSGANTGNGYCNPYGVGSGGFTMRYPNTQAKLASTTGTVVYLNSGGYHNYFWKSTGSFTV